ncbi:hypothetical protein JW935_28150 [candidate division KSB1 bacterium]|nr:hypothetical protein [candidate division KSB1 bacterium]
MSLQIANFHISGKSKLKGKAHVTILSRKDAAHSGGFTVDVNALFPNTDGYPTGSVKMTIDLSDSMASNVASTSIEQINCYGKHNPTVVMTGRCKLLKVEPSRLPHGYRFWLMIANNKSSREKETPDIIGFVIFDQTGQRVSYGMGPVDKGDVEIVASGD